MKKTFLFLLFPALCVGACSQKHDVVKNSLRAPAYPLVTIDPNTSAWSMSDNLYDGSVKHWTGKDFPLIGAIKVDGETYRFMGTEEVEMLPVVPSSLQGEWFGQYTTDRPADTWKESNFNDAAWKKGKGAFGMLEAAAKTQWTTEYIWVRRKITISEDLTGRNVYLEYSNDDDAEYYINGKKVFDTGCCHHNETVKLSDEIVSSLKAGENLIAAYCRNTGGNALLDFGILVQKDLHTTLEKTAVQTSVDVQATQTHYAFSAGAVDLKISFSAPLFMDNLKLMTRPVNYISYEVASNDGKAHDVELYLEASPRWALDQPYQESETESFEDGGLLFAKSGSKAQEILAKKGDDLRIDWGYFYLAAEKANTALNIGASVDLRNAFVNNVPLEKVEKAENANGQMAIVRNLGATKAACGKFLIGYDDLYSIQYFEENLRPYWNTDGKNCIVKEMHAANADYKKLMDKCFAFDKKLMEDATKAGGVKYAELCALAYRQAIAAHKLVQAPNGDLLWLSKENNSNGSIGTVDVTYPSAPLFLYYNVELAKGLLNHIFYYSESGKWTKPFPSHDVGTYPLANGQTYGGDMPIEEDGNMLTLTAAIATVEGNAKYAEKHWETLSIWADYLVEYGLDPENQLCTDDFAGHFAHNVNLSVKAIMGIASYGKLAKILGKNDIAEKYTKIAKDYATKWAEMANDADHYRLTFDKPDTWSQKYNLVWDEMLGFNIFPENIADTEIKYYLTKQNEYGLPLDNRRTYTKTDWIIWTATLADDKATFEKFIDPIHKFFNETIDRVPMSDWTYTDKPTHSGFKARSVVGGYWIKLLDEKID